MNASSIARHYDRLTPEERFCLILAAGARGDEAEQDRLARAGGRITLSMQDHAPYAYAFDELAVLVFLELLEEAARYLDALARADDVDEIFGGDEQEEDGDQEGDSPGGDPSAAAEAATLDDDAGADDETQPFCERYFRLALAAGYVLRATADGWKLFWERLGVPPFALWERLPGYARLRRALALAEGTGSVPGAAFNPEGFLRWMNETRPEGAPELTKAPFTVEGHADAAAGLFRYRAEWWGGK